MPTPAADEPSRSAREDSPETAAENDGLLPALAPVQKSPSGRRDSEDGAAAKAQIRAALQGSEGAGGEQKSSGDPILDDVLQIIRRQGSILDGTALDPQAVEGTERAAATGPPIADGPAQAGRTASGFRTAESLLRAARLLESQPTVDAARRQLVRQMRSEAARCLQHALGGSSLRRQPTGGPPPE